MNAVSLAIVFFAGLAMAIQAPLNALLKKGLSNVWLSGSIIALLETVFFGILLLFLHQDFPSRQKFLATPWYAYTGAIFGCVVVYASLSQTQKVGAGVYNSLIVAAAVTASLAFDHFGWLGVEQREISAGRIAGAVLMMAGVGLIAYF